MAPATGSEWWVISFNPLGGAKSTYEYFFGSKAGADAKANLAVDGSVTGPFASKAAAQAAVAAHHVTPPNTNTTGIHPGNPLTGLNAIGDFFQRLTQAVTWERVAEAVAGGLLIYVALKAMFPGVASAVAAPVKGAADAAKVGALM
jgi:hypothetical protein